MYEQTHIIQKEVSDLSKVIETFEKGFKDLESRHNKNYETIQNIKTSVSEITNTSQKIQNLDLENKKIGEQKIMNYVIWDVETDSADTNYATIIEIGALLFR